MFGKHNLVWVSLEQGMQCRSHYFQYAVDRVLYKEDLDWAVNHWGAAHANGPGNFHLPDHLDAHLESFIAFNRVYVPSTATVSSLTGGLSGVPAVLHSLRHFSKTDPKAPQADIFPFMFDILKDNGFNVAGFHIFKDTGPGFVLPDFGQGWEPEMKGWPNPIPSHRNYITPVARLNNHLKATPAKPHAIFIHIFAQAVPAVLEVLAENGITTENTIFLIIGDHGHPNWDLDGKTWPSVHDIAVDEMNSRVYCRFYYPGCQPEVVQQPCSSLDFFPTIMNLLRIDTPQNEAISELSGVNLLPCLGGEAEPERQAIRVSNRYHFQLFTRSIALISGEWKYQYVHFQNIFLHDFYKDNGVVKYSPERIFRVRDNGDELEVNIENRRITDLLSYFRRLRVKWDKTIQGFWMTKLEDKIKLPPYVRQLYNEIDPEGPNIVDQIKLSEKLDFLVKNLLETSWGRRVELIGEIKYATEPHFYYRHYLPTLPEFKKGNTAIWGVGDYYQTYVRPHLNRLNACYYIDENSINHGSLIDQLPVYKPQALPGCPVDVVLICKPLAEFHQVVKTIRSMDLAKQPEIA